MNGSRSSKALLPYAREDDGHQPRTFKAAPHRRWTLLRTLCAVVLATYLFSQHFLAWAVVPDHTTKKHPQGLPLKSIPQHLKAFQTCSINDFLATDLTFMDTAQPLPRPEFVDRRDKLAQALANEDIDAFIVEPGYTFSYYGNVTQTDWEVWEPEERPFLMVVLPARSRDGRDVRAETWFLVPSFEAERARLLDMPFTDELSLIGYEEHWNPYQTLLTSPAFSSPTSARRNRKPRVMVDEEIRDFISRGLADNGFDVRGLGGAVEEVRQRKSAAEIGILRAVNTGTVEAVRAMRKCLEPGLTEEDVMLVLDNTMRAGGLDPFFDIVLFDEDASNPHGGTDGFKVIANETMVLIDVGAHLYGYSSDICRSFFPPFFTQPEDGTACQFYSRDVQEKLRVWDIVFEAQTASLEALRENSTAAAVDIAARTVIEEAGYGDAFTHRVGHGIGIKAHESPYLNKGNVATLRAGMTFTSEPGIYLVDKFGVRHEDVLLVRGDGLPELLTGRRATSAWEP
ncbi:Creatinase/aminopeptidase [Teratosphaeria nubilosa]|uniref:Creatinase/aminopeptidase n=1 Tax=Teratosphaeria nubilosa TaxID=161662 RepID=A0A6G1LFY6_9PEZI|nr:Creatinase/aminopeptidase [Teratosphaeria nubilosa]